MPNLAEERMVELYGRAEAVAGQNAEALCQMALLAWEQRRDRDAMRVLSFVWGRNARLLARAVGRWPQYFMTVDGAEAVAMSPDELLALFAMSALPAREANALHRKWRNYSWPAWQVREKIEDWRGEQQDPALLRLRHPKVQVLTASHARGDNTLVLGWKGTPRVKAKWLGKTARLLLTERDDG